MKKPYRNKFLKITNIYNPYKNTYKKRYNLLGIKYTIPDKNKILFFKQKKEEKNLTKYLEYKKEIDILNECRNNKNPVLTIILLTYNHKSTIEKCITSLLEQETQYNYIIKICDDASCDGTTEICFEYAKRYPEKIEYVLQPKNTNCKHFFENVKNIKSKYWCFIDGDDWWISSANIEKAVSFLESNSEYITYGSNFYWNGRRGIKDFNKDVKHFTDKNCDIDFNSYIYIHPSARIHRNVINWSDKKYNNIRKSDIIFYFIYLSQGKCYFDTALASVYNYNGQGICSSKSDWEQAYFSSILNYTASRLLKWKYDNFFAARTKTPYYRVLKYFLGRYLGWRTAIYFAKQKYIRLELKKIKQKYKDIDEKYCLKDRYLNGFIKI